MNIPGLILIVIGSFYIIYSGIHKNEISINRSDKFMIIDKERFLTLQLYFSIFNSLCMITFGVVIVKYSLSNIYVFLCGVIFIFTNYIFIPISIKKGYLKYK